MSADPAMTPHLWGLLAVAVTTPSGAALITFLDATPGWHPQRELYHGCRVYLNSASDHTNGARVLIPVEGARLDDLDVLAESVLIAARVALGLPRYAAGGRALSRLAQVLVLHHPDPRGSRPHVQRCACGLRLPCPTFTAITGGA